MMVEFALLALFGLCLSSLFSGMETGIYTLNPVRLMVRSARGDRRALRLQREMQPPGRLLATLLVGNNLANYLGTFAVAAMLKLAGMSDMQVIIVNACVLIPLLFVFGETLPKDLFRTHTDHWSYVLSGPLVVCRWALTFTGLLPIVHLFSRFLSTWFAADDRSASDARVRISQLIREGVGVGVLSEAQTSLADRVLQLRDLGVCSVMTPWSRVSAVHCGDRLEARLDLMRLRNFTRFPVINDHGDIVGVISLLDALLKPDQPTSELLVDPLFLTAKMSIREAVQAMRTAHAPLAMVIEETSGHSDEHRSPRATGYGKGPLGLVTLKDLIEPLTGQLAPW